jgi:hypothetical protein
MSLDELIASLGVNIASNAIFEIIKSFSKTGQSSQLDDLQKHLASCLQVEDAQNKAGKIIEYISQHGNVIVNIAPSDNVGNLIKNTRIDLVCRNNYLDFLSGAIDRQKLYFNIDIRNISEAPQHFEVDVFAASISGQGVGPFSGNYEGKRYNISHLGNRFYVRPDESQTIKILDVINIDPPDGTKDQDIGMHFGTDDSEVILQHLIDSKTIINRFHLSQFLPLAPFNKPFIGMGIAAKITFYVHEWIVERYFYGGIAEKDERALLIEMLNNKNDQGVFFYLAGLQDSGFVLIKNQKLGEHYVLRDDTKVVDQQLNEAIPTSPIRSKYLMCANKTNLGCVFVTRCFYRSNESQIELGEWW